MDSDDDAPSDLWKNRLVFVEFDNRAAVNIRSEWTHSCLRTDAIMEEICGHNNITAIRLYQKHVNAATHVLAHHAFVVFKTEGPWKYSIEKNKYGITLQRSKCLSDILHAACEGIADTTQRTGKGSIGKVIHYLWQNNCLRLHYHPVASNCTHFALRIFNEFSYSDYYENSSDDDL